MGSLVLTHIEDVFKLLEKEDEFMLSEYKDVVLVLGNTGAGKSTFTHFLVGDDTKLQSVEIGSKTGEYTINDENNKIGAGLNSKTLYPERVVDRNSGIAYYDCPGFGDTRNAAYDIASNYFIKKITCHVRTVKIVLLVNYSSVRVGVDRFDFMKFIKHVTEFITDIEHFRNSIALVVTKVDNDCYKENGQYVTVSDHNIISKIANFICDAKSCLEEKLHSASSNNEKVYYQKAITLVDILLQENSQSNKVKIALFKRPDEAGVISEIDLLQKGKQIIQNMIGSELTFAILNGNDFGFSISHSSKNSVLKLFQTISVDITEDIVSTKKLFYESIEAKVKNSNDISHRNEELDLLYRQSKEILRKMQNSSDLKTFLVLLIDYLNLMDVRNGKSIFLKLFKKCEHIEFLEEISNERCLMKPTEWTKPLQNILEYILQTKHWYVCLTDLCEKLSSYKLHKNVMNDKFLKQVIEKNEYINLSNLSKVVQFLKKYNLKVDTHNTNIGDIQFQDLNNVFHTLNTNDVTITDSSRGDLVIKGRFVASTDIIRSVQNHNKKSVHVFALNTFYINEDIDFTGTQVNLLIIAPKWEVIGERKIVLDGASSESLSIPTAKVGEEGRPGCPGGPAGCFIGFCCKVINDEFLTISANGGNGGTGQNGGDGIPGRNAVEERPYGTKTQGKNVLKNLGYHYIKTDRKRYFDFLISMIPGLFGFTSEKEIDFYKVNGKKAEKGGDGYKAGCGGLGGCSGTVSLFGVEVSKIKITNSNGGNGAPGTGGRGGTGGKNADNYTCIFTQKNDYWFAWKFNQGTLASWYVVDRKSNGYAPAGKNNAGITNVGIQEPESVILFENESYIMNDYKRYLLSNLNDKISKYGLLKFYRYFSNNIHVKGTYDLLALAYELIDLEKEYCKSNNVELDSLYKDLLDRVLEHAKHINSKENTKDYKKLIIYICSAISSKIVNMRSKSEYDLVIDIDSYFSLIINNSINLLKSMDAVVKNEYNVSYKKAIEAKITEAKDLVNQNINHEIDYITKEIESKMLKILQDIEMQKISNETLSEAKQNQLQKAVEHKTTTGVLDFCKNILSYMFSFLETVTNIIQGACNIVDGFGLGHLVNKNPITLLIRTACSCISKMDNYVQRFIGRKIDALKHLIDNLFDTMNNYPHEDIIQVLNILIKILSYIKRNDNNNINPKKIISSIDEVKQDIQNKITNMEKAIKNKQGGQSFQILDILKNVFNRITVADAHTDTYLQYKDNEVVLDQICALHAKDSCKIEALREFETYILTNIHPMFLKMRNTIKKYQSSLPSQSRIALDISRWKLQTVFKDIKISLKKFVEKFELDNDLLQIFDKLANTVDILIPIYDKIQCYKEQKELADYIAIMTSERCNKIPVQNEEINNTITKLDNCIKANIIFGQFKKGIASFKQFIFPFAGYYLEEYHVPIEMNIEEVNLENLVECTSKQIEHLRSKVIENRSLLIKNFHQHIYVGNFQKGEKFGPFCIWESNKCKAAISRLLSGEKIMLYANVLNNNIDKNAVKFNAIQINFRSHDKSLEQKLNSKLKHFDVTATHMGNSYYRCNNRFYLLTSDSQTFYYSFEKDRTGEPIRMNEVYSKIKEGPYLLSPYATWSFQLTNVSGNFSELNEFKGKTDLELIGRGQYVSDECFISDGTLNKYYKSVDNLSVTDLLKG